MAMSGRGLAPSSTERRAQYKQMIAMRLKDVLKDEHTRDSKAKFGARVEQRRSAKAAATAAATGKATATATAGTSANAPTAGFAATAFGFGAGFGASASATATAPSAAFGANDIASPYDFKPYNKGTASSAMQTTGSGAAAGIKSPFKSQFSAANAAAPKVMPFPMATNTSQFSAALLNPKPTHTTSSLRALLQAQYEQLLVESGDAPPEFSDEELHSILLESQREAELADEYIDEVERALDAQIADYERECALSTSHALSPATPTLMVTGATAHVSAVGPAVVRGASHPTASPYPNFSALPNGGGGAIPFGVGVGAAAAKHPPPTTATATATSASVMPMTAAGAPIGFGAVGGGGNAKPFFASPLPSVYPSVVPAATPPAQAQPPLLPALILPTGAVLCPVCAKGTLHTASRSLSAPTTATATASATAAAAPKPSVGGDCDMGAAPAAVAAPVRASVLHALCCSQCATAFPLPRAASMDAVRNAIASAAAKHKLSGCRAPPSFAARLIRPHMSWGVFLCCPQCSAFDAIFR